jgi:hypothetical protein
MVVSFHQIWCAINIVTHMLIARQRVAKHIPAEANVRNKWTSIARQRPKNTRNIRKGIARSVFYLVFIYPLLDNGCVFYGSASRICIYIYIYMVPYGGGIEYIHLTLRIVEGNEKEPSAWGYNRANLFLGDISRATWPPRSWSLQSETVNYIHNSRVTRTWEWLSWRGPAAIVNERDILSSQRMLHKDYNRKCSVGK